MPDRDTPRTYAEIEAVNWSTLKHAAKSPKHFRHRRDNPEPDKPEWLIGRAIHRLVLEPETVDAGMILYDETKIRSGKKWEAFKEEHTGKDILIASEMNTAHAVAEALRSHPTASLLLLDPEAHREKVMEWTDEETGLHCKGRLDLFTDRVVDLKTTKDVDLRWFPRDAAKFGYHAQAAFYADGARACNYGNGKPPIIIAAEKLPPYDVACLELSDVEIEAGRRYYRSLLRLVQGCEAAGIWPGVASELTPLALPTWAPGMDLDSNGESEEGYR